MIRLEESREQQERSRSLSTIRHFLLFFLCVTLSTSVAYASGDAHHVASISDTFKYWPNFLVFLFIFIYLLRPPFRKFWADRREGIESAVTAGERELKTAMQELEAAKQALSSVPEEIERLKTSIRSETEREYNKILEDARKRAERIAEQASESVATERKAAEVEIRKELAERVVEQARQRLKSEVDASYDESLRQSAFKGMSNLVQ